MFEKHSMEADTALMVGVKGMLPFPESEALSRELSNSVRFLCVNSIYICKLV